ncbi:MAG: PqqD family protein [Pseudomonadota bacterium]
MTSADLDVKAMYQRKDVLSTQVDDDLIIFDEEQGMYFTTNGIGVVIWDLLEAPMSADALCEALYERYDVGFSQCRDDTRRFLLQMIASKLIHPI